uniref:Uncharacterized protein n=1 Tax=Tanacetum cinerariifolium TaxID=118510 RepID=A0A6L2MUF6_TANCI|nr:hypothetical protein [Tanacetum cinerariifolium]
MESSSSYTKERDLQQMQEEGNKLHSKCIAKFKYLETHLRLLNSYRYVDHFNSVIHIYMHEWKHNQFSDMKHKNINQVKNSLVQKGESITSLQALRTQFELLFKSPNVTCTAYSPLHKDFKESTHYEPIKYRSRLLHYLDELEKLLKERTLKDGELRLKENAVKAIKEIEKGLKDKEKQTQESMVMDIILVSQGTTLDGSLVTEGTLSAQKNECSTSGNDSSDHQPSSDTNTTSKVHHAMSVSQNNESENENLAHNSSLETENHCLRSTITELSNHFETLKVQMENQCAQFPKEFSKMEAQKISFEIALKHKTQENKSLISMQKENENFMASLQIQNAHLKKTYKELFESIQSLGCDSKIKELETILAQ